MKPFFFLLICLLLLSASRPAKNGPINAERKIVTPYEAIMWETKRREQGGVFHPHVYWDKGGAGSWAIGYGVRISPSEAQKWRRKGGITVAEANQLTVDYFENALTWVDKEVPGLPRHQQLAVASLVYTMGTGTLKRQKLWRYIKRKEVGAHVDALWRKTACGFRDKGRYHYRKNIADSRVLESALWHYDLASYQKIVQKISLKNREILLSRK